MIHTLDIECESGFLLIADPQVRASLAPDLQYWLAVFADPDGISALPAGFEEPWHVVQKRASEHVNDFALRYGRFAVLSVEPGHYFLQVDSEYAQAPRGEAYDEANCRVTIRSSMLEISDGADAAKSIATTVPVGEFALQVRFVAATPGPHDVVGVFGSTSAPSILLLLQPPSNADATAALLRSPLQSTAIARRLCRAEVKKVEDGLAVLRLRITERIWSGWGRLLVDAQTVLPGTQLMVRLREHSGAFWWCDLP